MFNTTSTCCNRVFKKFCSFTQQNRLASFWLRDETLEGEERTALTPSAAKILLNSQRGHSVTVERSKVRIFADAEYEELGCRMVESGSWMDESNVDKDTYILGLKELGPNPDAISRAHIYFAHAFKQQFGYEKELGRYLKGGGKILDLEFLVDPKTRRRVASFGYYAGYIGMGLGIAAHYLPASHTSNTFPTPLSPFSDHFELMQWIDSFREGNSMEIPSVVVLGALGAAGSGATEFFEQYVEHYGKDHDAHMLGRWDKAETTAPDCRIKLQRDYDVLVNCINLSPGTEPFLHPENILPENKRRLCTISDVSCDPNNPANPIPIYSEETSMKAPIHTTAPLSDGRPMRVIAISHLPSLLPRQASEHFSSKLVQHLDQIPESPWTIDEPVWQGAEQIFTQRMHETFQ